MLSEEKRALIFQLKEAGGMTIRGIARRVGCSYECARLYLAPQVRAERLARISARAATRRRERGLDVKLVNRVRLELLSEDDLRRRLFVSRLNKAKGAIYDPLRDGEPTYAEPSAAAMGDPPVGRRALLEKWAEKNPNARDGVS